MAALKAPNVKAAKIIQIQAVGMSGPPVKVQVPGLQDEDGKVVSEGRNEILAPITEVGILALRDDGSLFFRTMTQPWVEVPAIEGNTLEVDEDEMQRLAAKFGAKGGV